MSATICVETKNTPQHPLLSIESIMVSENCLFFRVGFSTSDYLKAKQGEDGLWILAAACCKSGEAGNEDIETD
ncbi:MAG: hypothetical protein EAY65_03695 [Alphaproteobacteria bacterium]|nr:MAG: hypothetical protein EAY65_03695 [Alphaproteobacteria bacterium]